ncbi:beta-mannosidase [Poriferisphaera sp. WC338]|uniref:beta-mannosidase n=1 Tax=Poriferisphaera sp. WC338 TaxID=3425129 RepID=UPI003D81673F
MLTVDLSGEWELSCEGGEGQNHFKKQETLAGQLPGEVHSALLRSGHIEDPYVGLNERDVQWIGRSKWKYVRTFEVDDVMLSLPSVVLELDEVDTFATVKINGKLAGKCYNAFLRYRFDVKKYLVAGVNKIEFVFDVAEVHSQKRASRLDYNVPSSICNEVKGLNFVRKPQCHGGWDWGITLMVVGAYGKMMLRGVEMSQIDSVVTKQRFKGKRCELEATVTLDTVVNGEEVLRFEIDGQLIERKVRVKRGENEITQKIEIKKPKRWWPRGYGEQHLYDLKVSCSSDVVSKKIGLREVELINRADEVGKSMAFRVNGQDIFCKGANWIPCDALPERQTVALYRQLLEDAAAVNMNMIRVWGGGQYEKDCFYEICDELGLMVWQDFMFACSLYPAYDTFLDEVADEVRYQTKRLHDYASIVLWCGDNEVIGALHWYDDSKNKRDQYLVQYDRLNRVIRKEVEAIEGKGAQSRVFWPSSPCNGPDDFGDAWHEDVSGDMHFWNVWHEDARFEDYYKVQPRFCSEFGFQSFAGMEAIAELTGGDTGQWNPSSPMMEQRQKCGRGNKNMVGMFCRYFRFPTGFEQMVYLSQVQQAIAIKTAIEYWRATRPVCMGALYWQLNDNWPVHSWSSIEHSGAWKQLHYHVKRFYEDVLVAGVQKHPGQDGEVSIHGVNDRSEGVAGKLQVRIMDFDGKVVWKSDQEVNLKAGSTKKFMTMAVKELPLESHECFAVMSLRVKGKKTGRVYRSENTHWFTEYKRCEIASAKIKTTVTGGKSGVFRIQLTTDKPAFFVDVSVKGVAGQMSDNSFTLLPSEPKVLVFKVDQATKLNEVKKTLCVHDLKWSHRES